MPAELALLVRITRRHRLEVGACAKIPAGAGEHRDGCRLVGIEGQEGIIKFARRRPVDGVAAMRAVDGNDGDGAIAFDEHGVLFGHGRRSLASLWRELRTGWAFSATGLDLQLIPRHPPVRFEIALA